MPSKRMETQRVEGSRPNAATPMATAPTKAKMRQTAPSQMSRRNAEAARVKSLKKQRGAQNKSRNE